MVLKFTNIFKYKMKLRKKLPSFLKINKIAKVNVGIYDVNSHNELNVKRLRDEMIHFH